MLAAEVAEGNEIVPPNIAETPGQSRDHIAAALYVCVRALPRATGAALRGAAKRVAVL